MRLKLSDIVKATGGRLLCGDEATVITAFSTDSRGVKGGTLFVPIRGERSDGHSFIDMVFENGGSATFTDHEIPERPQPVILVEDCLGALQKAAAYYRSLFTLPVVGVTGSVGKTTTKEMIAQVLTAKYHVMKTAGNQNSQVGVPLTICGLRKEHQAAVVEMGISMPGEMARLSAVVKPTLAVMTNIGVSHIEYLKTRENIMGEKAKIADHLLPDAPLFVNGDDDLLPTLRSVSKHRVICFGLGPHCDWRASSLNEMPKGTFFTCHYKNEKLEVFVPAAGLHNVRNALVSLGVAHHLGVPMEDAVRALAAYKAPAMRQEIFTVPWGLTVIDDSYNASPDSMQGAIDVLMARPAAQHVAVLADMLELGAYSSQGHREVGAYAKEKGVDLLVGIGELSRDLVAGFNGTRGHWFSTNEEALVFLRQALHPADTVLVKGSRGMKTDEIVAALKGLLQQENES